MATTRMAVGVVDLIESYDGFIVDVWGTLHDGLVALPGAIECLSRLRARGKRTVLLSNAPRRSEVEARHLDSLGIGEELFDGLLTAGESCRRTLACGPRYLHVGPSGNRGLLDREKFEEATGIESADFILVTGLSEELGSLEAHDSLLNAAFGRNMPMVCVNPDRHSLVGERRVVRGGALAARYRDLGGEVRYFGKPFREIYREAVGILGGIAPPRIVVVGDSLTRDIAGAQGAGLDAAFVLGGIDTADWDPACRQVPNLERLIALFAAKKVTPKIVLPAFVWSSETAPCRRE